MRSNISRKTPKNVLKTQFQGLISRDYMIFGTGNPNLRSILKPEVYLMVFLRMRSNTSNFQCIYRYLSSITPYLLFADSWLVSQ